MDSILMPLTISQWALELAISLLLVNLGWTVKRRVPKKTGWDTVKAWIGILTGTGSAIFISLVLLYKFFN